MSHFSSLSSSSLALVVLKMASFVPNESYVQFVVSRRNGEGSPYLRSTFVVWIPSRLIDAGLWTVINDNKNCERSASYGNHSKCWVDLVEQLIELHESQCVLLTGRELGEVKGVEVTVVKQFFSCDDY
jgi:hypothetical protein